MKKNGFNRTINLTSLQQIKNLPLEFKASQLIQVNDSIITILEDSYKKINQIDYQAKSTKTISIEDFKNCKLEKFHNTSIQGNIVTVFDPKSKSIGIKNYSNPKDSAFCIKLNNSLIRGCRISNTSIVRALDSTNKFTIFFRINMTNKTVQIEKNISEKIYDGGLSTDGILIPIDGNKVVLLYYHKNTYLCLDTTLTEIFKHHTIDTSTTAPKIKNLPKGGYAFSEPVKVKNLRGSYDNGIIYINSALIAENENKNNFRSNSVIDKYEFNTGKYLGSFYIPRTKDNKITDFKVYNDKLYALYESELLIFEMTKNR
ncbi:MAG TPA: hypothetical protein VFN30_12565 [Chitinophagaceae bacterium]|nr:hypothetical protein [Chitinophagaceae bacterium]